MKTFLKILGAVFLALVLVVGGSLFYLYKNAGAAFNQIGESAIERYISQHAPGDPVVSPLKRMGNAMKLHDGLSAQGLAMIALSALGSPRAQSADQVRIINDAAEMMETSEVTMADIGKFQQRYERYLPEDRRKSVLARQSGEATAADTNVLAARGKGDQSEAPAPDDQPAVAKAADGQGPVGQQQADPVQGARESGCSAGVRTALKDVAQFPSIAACAASWRRASMWAEKNGRACGGKIACASPADACAAHWHVCGVSKAGADELRSRLSAQTCAQLARGRFVAGLSDVECSGCGEGGGHGAVCCGRACVQQHGDCVWPQQTAWAGQIGGHINACGDIEMTQENGPNGVLCCKDEHQEAASHARHKARRKHRR